MASIAQREAPGASLASSPLGAIELGGGGKLWIALVAGLLMLVADCWHVRHEMLRGLNDFPTFYAGARLTGTALYNEKANYELQRRNIGTFIPDVYFTRPAFYALFLRPLGWFSYLDAYWLWQGINLAALAAFLWLFYARFPAIVAVAALSGPVYSMIANGQDVALMLLFLGLCVWCLERRMPLNAGLVLSMCAIKPHLVFVVPLVLVVRREWRAVAGLALGGSVLMGLSFVMGGVRWVPEYIALLSHPGLHQHGSFGLRTAVEAVGLKGAVWAFATALICAMAGLWTARRSESTTVALAYAIPFSLLGAFHVYMHDLALLLVTCGVAAIHRKKLAGLTSAATIAGPLGFLTPPWSLVPLSTAAATAAWSSRHERSANNP